MVHNNKKSGQKSRFKTCAICKIALYFSRKCHVNSWNHHENLCQTINCLEKQHLANISNQTTFNTQFPKEKAKLVDVINNEYSL